MAPAGMRKFGILLLALLLCGCGTSKEPEPETVNPTRPTAAETAPPETLPEETEHRPKTFTLSFAGDCTFGAAPSVYYAPSGFVQTVGDDYGYPFRNVIEYFENDDFSMVNLEGPLGNVGLPIPKQHNFRGPAEFVNILTENSIEAVTLANNHTMDFGVSCYESTLDTLSQAGVPFVERDSTLMLTLEGGLTLGIYGTSYEHVDEEDLAAQISGMKAQGADIVIYAAHWGVENSYTPHPQQIHLGHLAVDAGADIVFGTHPHVLQPIEEYNGGVIFYSLGNFSFGGYCGGGDHDTAIIQQQVILDARGNASLGQRQIIPCSMSSVKERNDFQPTPYEPDSEDYARVLQKLTGTYDK